MDTKEIIKKRLEDLLALLQIDADISIKENQQIFYVNLSKTDAALLIGFQGENLRALQHILRSLIFKDLKGENFPTIILDIEDYRGKEEDKLKGFVKNMAEIVKQNNRAEALKPMSSYKRRLVHMAVSEVSGVETESYGEEPERGIIIKPKTGKASE